MPDTQTVIRITERKKSTTARSKIDTHPQRDQIIKDLVDGKLSQGQIVKKYSGLTQPMVSRYWSTNLKALVAPRQKAKAVEATEKNISRSEQLRRIREEAYHTSLMDMLNESQSNLEAYKTQGNLAAVESILCGSRTNALKFLEKALETDKDRELGRGAPPTVNIFGKYIALPHVGESIEYEDAEVIEGEEPRLQIASPEEEDAT